MVSAAVINKSAARSISSKSKLLYLSASLNVDMVESSNLKLSKNKNNHCWAHSLSGLQAIIISASSKATDG